MTGQRFLQIDAARQPAAKAPPTSREGAVPPDAAPLPNRDQAWFPFVRFKGFADEFPLPPFVARPGADTGELFDVAAEHARRFIPSGQAVVTKVVVGWWRLELDVPGN